MLLVKVLRFLQARRAAVPVVQQFEEQQPEPLRCLLLVRVVAFLLRQLLRKLLLEELQQHLLLRASCCRKIALEIKRLGRR